MEHQEFIRPPSEKMERACANKWEASNGTSYHDYCTLEEIDQFVLCSLQGARRPNLGLGFLPSKPCPRKTVFETTKSKFGPLKT